jgi:hypothetical protein
MPIEVTIFADNDAAVPNEAILYRRVDWDKIGGRDRCEPGEAGRLNGNCFTDYSREKALELGYSEPCMSVGISTVLKELGLTPDKMLEGYEEYGLAQVSAAALRNLTRADGSPCPQGIMLVETEEEPWHGVVFDLTNRPRKTSVCKAIARVATWTIPLLKV